MKSKIFSKNTKAYLEKWGKSVVKQAKINLVAGKKGGGKLQSSIGYKLKDTKDGYLIQFEMEDYGKFQDKGVKGAGGTIKTGKHEGSWGGRRHYITWEGVRKDSPYKFGSGKGSGSIYKGIEGFIKKKGIKGRSSITGRYITQKSLEYAMVKVLWIKGMHGISFFQKSLQAGLKGFDEKLSAEIVEDMLIAIRVADGRKQK